MLSDTEISGDFVITIVDAVPAPVVDGASQLDSELVLVEDEDGMIELVEFMTVGTGPRKRILQANAAPPLGRYRAAFPTPAQVDENAETGIFLRSGSRCRRIH